MCFNSFDVISRLLDRVAVADGITVFTHCVLHRCGLLICRVFYLIFSHAILQFVIVALPFRRRAFPHVLFVCLFIFHTRETGNWSVMDKKLV